MTVLHGLNLKSIELIVRVFLIELVFSVGREHITTIVLSDTCFVSLIRRPVDGLLAEQALESVDFGRG